MIEHKAVFQTKFEMMSAKVPECMKPSMQLALAIVERNRSEMIYQQLEALKIAIDEQWDVLQLRPEEIDYSAEDCTFQVFFAISKLLESKFCMKHILLYLADGPSTEPCNEKTISCFIEQYIDLLRGVVQVSEKKLRSAAHVVPQAQQYSWVNGKTTVSLLPEHRKNQVHCY